MLDPGNGFMVASVPEPHHVADRNKLHSLNFSGCEEMQAINNESRYRWETDYCVGCERAQDTPGPSSQHKGEDLLQKDKE